MYIVKRSAAVILFFFVGIVVLSAGAMADVGGNNWAPSLKDLTAMPVLNAILVNLIAVASIGALIYLFVA